MLVGLAALYFAGMLAVHEGFASSMLRCPTPEYTFFNDSAGASFCCRGRVNPYTHQCGAVAEDDLCAFVTNTSDPRNPKRMLRL